MDRRDLGSWLNGPGAADGPDLPDQAWRGQLLGCAQDGPGSVATLLRRVFALLVDWFACVFVLSLISAGQYGFGADPSDAQRTQLLTLALFVSEVTILTWLGGASAGQRIVGIGVRRIDGQRLDPLRALMRTALICLVIPAVVYDRDGRGLHDRAAGTIVVRSR